MASGGFGGGMPHQDYPLPLARPPGITFSRVNRARLRLCSQQNITAPSIVRPIFCLGSFFGLINKNG